MNKWNYRFYFVINKFLFWNFIYILIDFIYYINLILLVWFFNGFRWIFRGINYIMEIFFDYEIGCCVYVYIDD